jgi:sigma-B regulation protein RsbU (phosphoserine phosphatase)
MDAAIRDHYIRSQLRERRRSLATAIGQYGQAESLVRLLQEVDSALERMNAGGYGLCDVCHDGIESDRLLADPLLRTCLDHLTPDDQRHLEEDLDLAARIQRKLLPPKSLKASGWESCYHYEPAGSVSGDYCDFISSESGDGSLYILLGDVSGKGIAASMLMAHLHALFRGLISAGSTLESLAQRANRIFCESTISTHYATLVLARADADGTVIICNSGHPAPLLIRANELRALEATGLPIGMFCELEYAAQKIHLQSGDALLLYTDGLTEARDASGNEYGEDRLKLLASGRRNLSPQDLVAAVIADLRAFRGAAPVLDDLTVMGVRRIN